MTECEHQPTRGGRSLTRRRLLGQALVSTSALAAVALLPGLTGCTPSDPRIDAVSPAPSGHLNRTTPPSPSSPASAPVTPGTDETAASEQALADLAAAILAGPPRSKLTTAQRRTLTAVRDGHRQHAAALRSPATSAGTPGSPSPGLAKLSVKKSLLLLAGREQQQAGRLRRGALAADGGDALLRGSMMVAATGYAGALRGRREVASVASARPGPATAAVSDVAALQSVVRQLHALVYGYQVALGQLSASSPPGRRALAALAARRGLRDRLAQILLDRSAAVPAAAGAYVPLVQPTTAHKSQVLIRRMETAFEPFCGLWLASAARADDRRLALESLADTAAAAQEWGAAVRPWPGWPD